MSQSEVSSDRQTERPPSYKHTLSSSRERQQRGHCGSLIVALCTATLTDHPTLTTRSMVTGACGNAGKTGGGGGVGEPWWGVVMTSFLPAFSFYAPFYSKDISVTAAHGPPRGGESLVLHQELVSLLPPGGGSFLQQVGLVMSFKCSIINSLSFTKK